MKRGNLDISNPMRGTTPVNKVMRGTNLVWERGTKGDIEVITHAGQTMFRIKTDYGFTAEFYDGTTQDFGNGIANVTVEPETLTKLHLNENTRVFKFEGQVLTENQTAIKEVRLHSLNGSTSLLDFCRRCDSMETFVCTADLSVVTDFERAWNNNALTHFPAIDTSSGTTFFYTWSACDDLICIDGTLDFTNLTEGGYAFNCDLLEQPPPTGSAVRDGIDAIAGVWTNPDSCP